MSAQGSESFEWAVRDSVARAAVPGVFLLLAGILIAPLERRAADGTDAWLVQIETAELDESMGQAILAGVVGGFRGFLADLAWIQTHLYWEQRDAAKTARMIALTVSLDPRPDLFWLNGARMIAYDIPRWRIERAGGHEVVPPSLQRRIRQEQARSALDLLKRARAFHPERSRLIIEQAMVHLNALDDIDAALELFRQAASVPDAPFYTGRIYGELLRRAGRPGDAYVWYVHLFETLPRDQPYALLPLVLERIRQLEAELEVPPGQRYEARTP